MERIMKVDHAKTYILTGKIRRGALAANILTHVAHGTMRHFKYGESATLVFRVNVTGRGREDVYVEWRNGIAYAHLENLWPTDDRDEIQKLAAAAVAAYYDHNKL
jgi:hypothetical protein